jgi:cell division protease FtsH
MGGSARLMASEDTNKLIDSEIRALVDQGYARASDVLRGNEDKLHLLAQALLEYETLTGEEIKILIDGGQLDRPDPAAAASRPLAAPGAAVPKSGRRFNGAGLQPQGA